MPTFDEELVRLCQAGRLEAFNLLMSRWEAKVLNFAYHFLGDSEAARDVCQEAFLRALRHVRTYEPKPTFSAWLFGIARNLCIDAERRRRVRGPTAEPIDEADPAPSPPERAERNERAELVGIDGGRRRRRACRQDRAGVDLGDEAPLVELHLPAGAFGLRDRVRRGLVEGSPESRLVDIPHPRAPRSSLR